MTLIHNDTLSWVFSLML